MPCPGPQVMLAIVTSELPCPTEMQSSPVPICDRETWTLELLSMWIPSVLGLLAGAEILILLPLKFLHSTRAIWKDLLFTEVILRTIVFFIATNFTFWKKKNELSSGTDFKAIPYNSLLERLTNQYGLQILTTCIVQWIIVIACSGVVVYSAYGWKKFAVEVGGAPIVRPCFSSPAIKGSSSGEG